MAKLSQDSNLLPQCLICGQTPDQGIIGGVLIRKHFLCDACQERILETSIEEPFYQQMKEGLKELWAAPFRVKTAEG